MLVWDVQIHRTATLIWNDTYERDEQLVVLVNTLVFSEQKDDLQNSL